MVEIPWTPIHEPIFLEIGTNFSCCVLRIPSEPRNRLFSEIPLTHSDFNRMIPIRREQHAAGRYCLSTAITREGIRGEISLSEDFPLRIESSNGVFPVSISHSDSLAVAVIGREGSQVGVDLESLDREIQVSILDQFCTQKEIKLLTSENSNFQRLTTWMTKEAVSKATGKGMSTAKEIILHDNFAQYQSTQYRLFTHEFENHIIIVAYSDSPIES